VQRLLDFGSARRMAQRPPLLARHDVGSSQDCRLVRHRGQHCHRVRLPDDAEAAHQAALRALGSALQPTRPSVGRGRQRQSAADGWIQVSEGVRQDATRFDSGFKDDDVDEVRTYGERWGDLAGLRYGQQGHWS